MHKYEHYLPVVLVALTVLILGCLNPKGLQTRNSSGQPSGCPSYMWLSLFGQLVGMLTVYFYRQEGL